jgi:hypothetical protein
VRKIPRVLVIAGLLGFLSLGGVALAFWTAGGTGSGSVATSAGTSVVVHQTSTATGLYPGDSIALSGNFDNPNSGSVTVTAVTATIATFSSQTDSTKPACTQADFSITGTSNNPGSIPSGTAVGSWNGLALNMVNSAANQDNCKGLTGAISINYAVS